jgi:hypothetical protein
LNIENSILLERKKGKNHKETNKVNHYQNEEEKQLSGLLTSFPNITQYQDEKIVKKRQWCGGRFREPKWYWKGCGKTIIHSTDDM